MDSSLAQRTSLCTLAFRLRESTATFIMKRAAGATRHDFHAGPERAPV
jgi:hypothetical protein